MRAYNTSIVGRYGACKLLQRCVDSDKAEFIAMGGRRRVGKTYLIKRFFDDNFDFYTSGICDISNEEQLVNFVMKLQEFSGRVFPQPKNWFEAFNLLKQYLSGIRKKRIIVFIDELPWHDAPKSNFTKALESFWNTWGADQPRLKLIVCGSSTTWMVNKLLGNRGGLHNRVTRRIFLHPFTLGETEQYLDSRHFNWDRKHIVNCYMALGGTPYYLSLLQKDLSLEQNIDKLFYGENPELKMEYEFLFRSLFSDSVSHKRVVELLSTKMAGMSRGEIVESLNITDNGGLTEVLSNLEKCDFIRQYAPFGKKQRGTIYQLTDLFSLFYLRFVRGYKGQNLNAWSSMSDHVKDSWRGYAFEQVCLLHVQQIKHALGINGISADVASWSANVDGKKSQIDLVIDRADRIVNLCEMKYSESLYDITKEYADYLRTRREQFRTITKTRKSLQLTFVTMEGVKPSKNSCDVNSQVYADDLFYDLGDM